MATNVSGGSGLRSRRKHRSGNGSRLDDLVQNCGSGGPHALVARIIGHGDVFLGSRIDRLVDSDGLGRRGRDIDRGSDHIRHVVRDDRLVKVIEVDSRDRGVADDRHVGKVRVVRHRLRRLLLCRSAPQRAFGSTAGGNSLLVDGQRLVGVGVNGGGGGRSHGHGSVIRNGLSRGGVVGGVSHERHKGGCAARRGGMRARDGARSGCDVVAVIGAGLPAVGEFVDSDLVDVA